MIPVNKIEESCVLKLRYELKLFAHLLEKFGNHFFVAFEEVPLTDFLACDEFGAL